MIMSMGRLLAAGKSLVGAQNASSRFRLDKRGRLPKFGSAKNPFASEPRKPAAVEPTPLAPTAPAAELAVHAMPAADNPPPPPPATARLRRAVRRLREWCVEANPIPRLAGPARSAFSPMPGFTGAPIQSELSLDEVKVVRNDLSDADLEVVPAKPARRADSVPLPEANAWSRLTTRIFVRPGRD
jgi:hypothetical protein